VGLSLSKEDFSHLRARSLILVLLAAWLIQYFILGDMLYTVRYQLREAAAYTTGAFGILSRASMARITAAGLLYLCLFFVINYPFSKKKIIGTLVVFAVASSIALTLSQSMAGYNTGAYNYGEHGRDRAVRYIRSRVAYTSKIIAPAEIIEPLQLPYALRQFNEWNNTTAVERLARDPAVSALVYGVTSNTIEEIQRIENTEAIVQVLRQGYTYSKIGSFSIWLRKR